MSPAEARHVTFSYGRVFPYRKQLTEAFYDSLFDIAPEMRPLFPADMTGQREKLSQALNMIITHLADIGDIIGPVKALGARHRAYGVTAADYEVVGLALVAALKKVTPGGLSPAEERAWVAAYNVLADAMANATDADLRSTATA
ncbi:MAG: globin domain-containing protein [Pseudomonadota bacterium]